MRKNVQTSVLGVSTHFLIIPYPYFFEDRNLFIKAIEELAPENHILRSKFKGNQSEL